MCHFRYNQTEVRGARIVIYWAIKIAGGVWPQFFSGPCLCIYTFHPHLTALCMPLPFGLQLLVLSLPLLPESSPRLLFTVATTVYLCFGLIYFNLLSSNNISRPEVRKARKRVHGKLLDVAIGKLQVMMQKESKRVFLFMPGCCLLFCAHTHKCRRCPAVLLAA